MSKQSANWVSEFFSLRKCQESAESLDLIDSQCNHCVEFFFFFSDFLSWPEETLACFRLQVMLLFKYELLPRYFYCVTMDSMLPLMINAWDCVGFLVFQLARISGFFRCLTPFPCRQNHLHSLKLLSAQHVERDGFCNALKSHFIQPESCDETIIVFLLMME